MHDVKHADACSSSIAVDSTFSEAFLVREVFSIAKGTDFFREERCTSPCYNRCGEIY